MKVRFLSYEQIGEEVQKVLSNFKYDSSLPVLIEKLIDNDLKKNIVPFPNLYSTFHINAITSSDMKTIYVDEYLYTNLELAYRFTLAHELGHIILHRKIYEVINLKPA